MVWRQTCEPDRFERSRVGGLNLPNRRPGQPLECHSDDESITVHAQSPTPRCGIPGCRAGGRRGIESSGPGDARQSDLWSHDVSGEGCSVRPEMWSAALARMVRQIRWSAMMLIAVILVAYGINAATRADWPVAVPLLLLSLPFDYLTIRIGFTRPARRSPPSRLLVGPHPSAFPGDVLRQMTFREAFRGYRPSDVDALLGAVALALDSSADVTPLMRDLHLHQAIRGYNRDDVDRAIERLRLSM